MFLSVRPVGLFSRFLRREPQQQRDATRHVVCIAVEFCRRGRTASGLVQVKAGVRACSATHDAPRGNFRA